VAPAKPDDYRLLFEGNTDDAFTCGLRLTRKSVKLYSSFYKADLVIGSPLGVRLAMGGEGDKARDCDWLSSVELVAALHCDVLMMQNWAHVEEIFANLNALPKKQRETDFSRVRSYHLDGTSRYLRQTILLSAYASPEINSVLARKCSNAAGRLVVLPSSEGCVALAPSSVRQLFVRFDASSPSELAELRLSAFKLRLLPSLRRSLETGGSQTILFIPSYLDFVRVRALLQQEDVPFEPVTEYTEAKAVSRARAALRQRRLGGLLVYTERAHFFHRHWLRGASHIAIYAPPSNAHFFPELLQMMELQSSAPTCVCLFCRLDLLALSRLVGDVRASRMLTDEESSFVLR